jgi:hypothetical protein
MIWLLVGYIFLFIDRPFEVWPALGTVRLELIYILGVMAAWLVYPHKTWTSNVLNGAFLAFCAALGVCWLASPYRDAGTESLLNYYKVAIFYVLMLSTVRDERQLRQLLVGFLVVMALYMTHSFREYRAGRFEYRMGIVRMVGVDTTNGDPNTFSASLLYALPLTFPYWSLPTRVSAKLGLLYSSALTVLCIILTGSRRALLGVLCLCVLRLLGMKHRLLFAVVLAIAMPIGWAVLPDKLKTRFETIIDPSVGPKNAQESAEFRTKSWGLALELWQRNPLTGVGPNGFSQAAGFGLQTHNMYAQVVSEMGLLGIVTFGAVLAGFVKNAWEIRRIYRDRPDLPLGLPYYLSRSISTSLVLLMLMGFGGHGLLRYNWLWFGAFQILTLRCARQEADAYDAECPDDAEYLDESNEGEVLLLQQVQL